MFSGIGEFTIHKEFVSSKVAGDVASLTDPALDRILDFAGEVGPGRDPPQRHRHAVREAERTEPVYLEQMKDAVPPASATTTIIWAHIGLGRVHPADSRRSAGATDPTQILEAMLEDPALRHVHFDISWDEVAKYVVATPEIAAASRRR